MHSLPDLPYAFDALEPYIDSKTMEIHHGKHHKTYVDKLNLALEKHPTLFKKSVEELLADLGSVPEDIRSAVRNHGGGHANHSFFWEIMTSADGVVAKPEGELSNKIDEVFGSFEEFKKKFAEVALNRFGSGWAWLVSDSAGEISIISTPNQDTPLSVNLTPILGLDVWEHAYYLKHQSKRADYIEAWWNVVNWEKVEENYQKIIQ